MKTTFADQTAPRPDKEDQALVRQIAAGDASALRSLYDKLARPLYSLALKMLSNPTDAEEIVQDVFLLVWKNAQKFDTQKAKVFTWLTVLTRNKCIDKLRAKKCRIPTADLLDEERQDVVPEIDGKTAADKVAKVESAKVIRSALVKLPADQREAIELAFFSDMTHVQVAESLGISVGTAKSRIRYGFGKLRSLLAEHQDLER